jgi:glycine/D-amino acid oxidase-like deaminating enzyme
MDLRTGCAFWMLKDGLLASYPSLAADLSADIAIIGAGITGALVAHELTNAGANVVVLDRRDAASGSTAASTGLLQYETDGSLEVLSRSVGLPAAARIYRLGLEAIDAIERICCEVGDASGFRRRSCLYLASSQRDARALAREHALRVANGFDVTWLTASDVKGRFGLAAPAALYGPGDGELDSYRFTHAVLKRAVDGGARVFDRTSVIKVRHTRAGVELVTDRGPRVRATRAIYAGGYETSERSPIQSLTNLNSTFVCVSEPVASFDGWEDRCLIWETARPYLYLRTTDDNRVVIGGEDSPFSARHRSERVLVRKRDRLIRRFGKMFPGIELEPAYVWGGVFGETRDGLPYIGARDGEPHAWYALGYGANGITFAMIAASILRDAYLGRHNADSQLFAFGRERRLQ